MTPYVVQFVIRATYSWTQNHEGGFRDYGLVGQAGCLSHQSFPKYVTGLKKSCTKPCSQGRKHRLLKFRKLDTVVYYRLLCDTRKDSGRFQNRVNFWNCATGSVADTWAVKSGSAKSSATNFPIFCRQIGHALWNDSARTVSAVFLPSHT
jgi:hypothetical protein